MADPEKLSRLFAEEAEMRLARLVDQLLELEDAPSDPDLIAAIFREAHTVKGSAALVGMNDVSRVAHAMEDILEELRSGARLASREIIDGILAAVDALREMVPALAAGEDVKERADQMEQTLRAIAAHRPYQAAESSEEPGETPPPAKGRKKAAKSADAPTGDKPSRGKRAPAKPKVAPRASRAPKKPPAETPNEAPAASEPAPAPTAAEGVPAIIGPDGGDGYPEPSAATRRARDARADESVRVPVSRLDEIVRLVGESAAAHLRIGRMLTETLGTDAGTVTEFRELSAVLNDLQERTMRARMVPVVTVTDGLKRAVRDLARGLNKNIRWEVRGEDTELDRHVLEQLADPLMHLVRNAVDHGIETAEERAAAGKPPEAFVRLHAMQVGSEVIVAISDDGRGIDVERVRQEADRKGGSSSEMNDEEALYLIFRSGLSTAKFVSDISGRGVGLDVVRTSIDAVRGRVEVRSEPGVGSEFRIVVPITLAVLPCLLVASDGHRFAVPMHSVVVAQSASVEEESPAEGQRMIWVGDQPVPITSLSTTLGLGEPSDGPVIVVSGLTRRYAFRVDSLIGQREVVVKKLGGLLPGLGAFAGASVEPDGSILLVLDAPGLIDRARRSRGAPVVRHTKPVIPVALQTTKGARILVVDDALTIRELQRSILERAGYDVTLATDGTEALERLGEAQFDLVLTDVEMPRMDGFTLTQTIREQATFTNMAIIILTSRATPEDKQRGMEAGADGYIVKSAFDETALLTAVERLLGRRK